MYTHHTEQVGDLTIRIVQDTDPLNPQEEFDNLGVLWFDHKRYDLGTPKKSRPYIDTSECQSWADVRAQIEKLGVVVIIPVWMYDHSGLALRWNRNFSDIDPGQWDSGQIGFAFVTKAAARKEYGRILTKSRIAKATKVLEGELKEYNDYLRGNVWGYQIEQEGDVIESCWGYFGDPTGYVLEEARNVAQSIASKQAIQPNL